MRKGDIAFGVVMGFLGGLLFSIVHITVVTPPQHMEVSVHKEIMKKERDNLFDLKEVEDLLKQENLKGYYNGIKACVR